MHDWVDIYFGLNFLLLFVLSLTLSGALVILSCRIPRLNGRSQNLTSVQSMHTRLTPRVGGIAIFSALCLSVVFAPVSVSESYTKFILATALLFFVGLLEDLGFDVSPRKRLLAAVGASLLVIALLGVWLPRTHIPVLDALMPYWFVGIPLTLLITAGIANGFNLIDGVNGLASMTAISAAVAMSLIAHQAGYTDMVHLALMLAVSVFGFFVVNYPFGRIFLGDAGAYTLGFVLSWFAIAILLNAPEASAWALLLVLFWPVADTLLAIYRRSRRKTAAMAPDRLHVHQMVMRALEICILGRRNRRIANPLTTLVLAPFVIAPPLVGIIFWDQTTIAFTAVIAFGILFFTSYAIAPLLIRRFR
ncbi:UDP-N-acetylmuramyl pentapeptide phosphotransferase/UDP-N-acetylglucosamine-1-phosphate transferase [Roseinatronobacter thiooxidans]|uniref:UDP-N-acetylmuramyl pentapeptide phosphotransferase/UDP-N-acetylglucosamine-1-phosphate transferase n=2 Tax=Roseinatronobacter thiooxidans TaxID=121821 RepID=A0A2W7Q2H0_9RHOB|nr:glycosyltransferase [Roseinatronobacter thiooxidans]PZX38327.1 UDP-N-acetylmuramyl pentapeptide phosphotransferase/UDP-N-acetylglucosamine-1-phosphate transferase [Roseinatronobacter thiooxidans]